MARQLRALVGGACLVFLASSGSAGQGPLSASVSPGRIGFPAPDVTDFEAGSVRFEGLQVDVRARGFVLWILTIRADDGDLGGYGKSVADLQWRRGDGDWRPLTPGGEIVAFGFRPRRVTLDFRTLLSWERDRPGIYGTGVTFEVSSLFGGPGASAGVRTGAAGGGLPEGETPSSICARISVATGQGGGAAGAAAAIEARCRRQVRNALRATEAGGGRPPGSR